MDSDPVNIVMLLTYEQDIAVDVDTRTDLYGELIWSHLFFLSPGIKQPFDL